MQHHLQAAEMGSINSLRSLGVVYMYGHGGETQNLTKSLHLLEKGGKLGDIWQTYYAAQLHLGETSAQAGKAKQQNNDGLPYSCERAIPLLEQVAERVLRETILAAPGSISEASGNSDPERTSLPLSTELAYKLYKEGSTSRTLADAAKRQYQYLGQTGDRVHVLNAAFTLERNLNTLAFDFGGLHRKEENDEEKQRAQLESADKDKIRMHWLYQRAALRNSAIAIRKLGDCHAHVGLWGKPLRSNAKSEGQEGRHVCATNSAEAARYYEKAASLGDVASMLSLGHLHEHGNTAQIQLKDSAEKTATTDTLFFEANATLALEWYDRCARAGKSVTHAAPCLFLAAKLRLFQYIS